MQDPVTTSAFRDHSRTSVSFQSEEKLVNEWRKFRKSNKYVNAAEIQDLNSFDSNTTSYKFLIHNIDNLVPKRQVGNDSRLGVRFISNFFSKKLKRFFGRTMESAVLQLDQTQGGQYVLQEPQSLAMYYHTKVNPEAQCIIVVEMFLYELGRQDQTLGTESLGYAVINMLKESKIDSSNQDINNFDIEYFRLGSPRELISISQDQKKTTVSLQYTIQQSEFLHQVKHLIPESCLIGNIDPVPGLQHPYHLPIQGSIQPENLGHLKISDIQIFVPEQISHALKDYISKQAQQEDIKINFKAQRLCAAIHNGWTLVNSNAMENSVRLTQAQGKTQADNSKVDVFESGMDLSVNNVYFHNIGLLVLQLEYVYEVFRKGERGSEEIKVLGFIPKPLLEIQSKQNTYITNTNFISAKGATVDGKKILDLGKYGIKLSLKIETFLSQNLEQKRQQKQSQSGYQQPRPEDQQQQQIKDYKRDDSNDRQNQQQQQQQQQPAQPQQVQSVYQQPQPQQIIQNIDYTRINQLQAQIDNYQEDVRRYIQQSNHQNQNNMQETQQVFDSLKKMIYELKQQQDRELQLLQQSGIQKSRPQTSGGRFYDEQEDYDRGAYMSNQDRERERMMQTFQYIDRKPQGEQQRAYTAEAFYNARDLKQGDLTFLASQGVRGLLDDTQMRNYDEENDYEMLKKEQQDPLRANIVNIAFISLKPRLEEIVKGQGKGNNSLYNEDFCIPERLYFSYNFYDYPLFKTDTISYEDAGNIPQLNKKLQQSQQIVLIKESYLQRIGDSKEPSYYYEVDPSKYNYKEAHRDFIKYIAHKSLHVDIWNADSLMLYGTIKIPLKHLLRRGNPVAESCKEYDIIDPNFQRIKGSLIVKMSNKGRQQEVTDQQRYDNQNQNQISQNGNQKQPNTYENAVKRKVKSTAPLRIPEQFKQQSREMGIKEDLLKDPEERRKLRISNWKINQYKEIENQPINNSLKQTENKKKFLESLIQYKQSKKDKFVKDVLSNFLNEMKNLTVFFARQEIISYEIINTSNRQAIYKIQINDPDEQFLTEPEFQLIEKPNEWQHWVTRNGYNPVNDFNQIQAGHITLMPGHKDPEMASLENAEQLVAEKDDSYRKKYINPRNISVFITDTNQKTQTQGFKLRVQPHSQVIDHLFRYYERENRLLNIVLPSLYHQAQSPRTKPFLHWTNKKAEVEWLNANEISLKAQAPQAAEINRFNILAYSDPYKSELLGNWQIEIHSLKGIELSKVKMGQAVPFKLTVDDNIQRTVKLYSSHPFIVGFREKDQLPRTIQPHRTEVIEAIAKSYSEAPKRVQINCVDVNSKELVHSWIVNIETDQPTISKKFLLECKVGVDEVHKFVYYNRAPNYYIYSFESSDPEIMEVLDSKVGIEKGQKEQIKIKFHKRDSPGIAEVYVFAQDENERNFEVLLFQVKYTHTI
ncbi:hypothetical protein PPERSA_05020 [Pseudocohnilembus persalinus]|uniref:Uncharacterized protein n=1 Tax=Pseudocohnilembus persalinus TaxID=266149 RepID=A0A0V0QVY4_PSEPJ|nr:hypothetical protein PPERSA_05020 [Pseudocohnilembus persalinus]|eukprot:KRX06407.1 hypothetical protein PPERSA_05020 [Pseudocohnilembus persalinus]